MWKELLIKRIQLLAAEIKIYSLNPKLTFMLYIRSQKEDNKYFHWVDRGQTGSDSYMLAHEFWKNAKATDLQN